MNPIIILKTAIDKVPFVKYALGVAGIIAAIAIIKAFAVENTKIPVISILIMLGLMVLLFVFSALSKSKDQFLKIAGYSLIFTTTIITCVSSFLLATSVFFNYPKPISDYNFFSVDNRFNESFSSDENRVESNANPITTWNASELAHACGALNEDYWITRLGEDCWPYNQSIDGYATYGPYVELSVGNYNVTWELAIGEITPEDEIIGKVQVSDFTTDQEIIKELTLYKKDFQQANAFKRIGMPFYINEELAGHKFEFRVYTKSNTTIMLRKVILNKLAND